MNTRARLEAAQTAEGRLVGLGRGGPDLDAYDLIATMRLEHQAAQVKARAKNPDNLSEPVRTLSDFERSHLRDAFRCGKDDAVRRRVGQICMLG